MNKETLAIYAAGLIQGITLVAFPASSTIITNSADYAFSNTAYGSLFIPQAILSIIAAAMNPKWLTTFGAKKVFLFGLVASLLAMVLFLISSLWMHHFYLAYASLFLATGFLGLGFGSLVPTLNEALASLYPSNVNFLLLILNALLGVGTALAPVLILLFVKLGFWWGLPLTMALLLILLLFFSWTVTFPAQNTDTVAHVTISKQFWLFASFALLYGVIETLNGNWASIYMKSQMAAPIKIQSYALTAFWSMVTVGRLFFALIEKFFSEKKAFQATPFISALAFIMIATIPFRADFWAISAFGLMGFSCSILLPLIISFGTIQLKTMAPSVPGRIISFYLLGYGIAAFGVGPMEEIAQINLRSIFLSGAMISFLLGVISLFIVQSMKVGGANGNES